MGNRKLNHNKKEIDSRKEQIMQQIKVRVGYACLNLSMKESFRNYRLATVEKEDREKITEVIWHNIRLLRQIVEYNVKHNIYVYRLSSDLVPFCTQPYIKKLYEEIVLNNEEMYHHFAAIRAMQEEYQLRLSIHPSQFNVLSSPKVDVVKRSVEEINGQTKWIRALKGENVVIHIGGSYGDKKSAIQRFCENLKYVDQQLISIENDDKTYHAEEVVEICQPRRLKWVYDYHHNRCHPSENYRVEELIKAYPPDKYHLSTGTPHTDSRPHAEYISASDYQHFVRFLSECGISEADVIFEAKKKNKAIFHILESCGNGYWKLEHEV